MKNEIEQITTPYVQANDIDGSEPVTPIILVETANFSSWLALRSNDEQAWLNRQAFTAQPGQWAWLGNDQATSIIAGWNGQKDIATLGGLPLRLPPGLYQLTETVSDLQLIGWGLGAYQFNRYKTAKRSAARLVMPPANNTSSILNHVEAISLTRDLINTSAQDMAPSHLQAEIQALADLFGADCDVIEGDALLDNNCGAIHAVGRAATDGPRLIDLQWGHADHPKVTLVGKGQCI